VEHANAIQGANACLYVLGHFDALWCKHYRLRLCVCVCVCVCARARASVTQNMLPKYIGRWRETERGGREGGREGGGMNMGQTLANACTHTHMEGSETCWTDVSKASLLSV